MKPICSIIMKYFIIVYRILSVLYYREITIIIITDILMLRFATKSMKKS